MRFTSPRDYQTILKINKELVNEVVDTTVIVYKVHESLTKVNSYGESPKKTWRTGVQIPCLHQRDDRSATTENQTLNITQAAKFAFLRQECDDRNIYPEIGDVIEFGNVYYEINTINENQFFAGRTEYNHSIVCDAHMSRITALQLEKPQV